MDSSHSYFILDSASLFFILNTSLKRKIMPLTLKKWSVIQTFSSISQKSQEELLRMFFFTTAQYLSDYQFLI